MGGKPRAELAPGQESVWDYPRPPRVERSSRRAEVVVAGDVGAATSRALRVLETSHPPAWYFPARGRAPGAPDRLQRSCVVLPGSGGRR
jgi:uncharacterized protein (DUF427 family)